MFTGKLENDDKIFINIIEMIKFFRNVVSVHDLLQAKIACEAFLKAYPYSYIGLREDGHYTEFVMTELTFRLWSKYIRAFVDGKVIIDGREVVWNTPRNLDSEDIKKLIVAL